MRKRETEARIQQETRDICFVFRDFKCTHNPLDWPDTRATTSTILATLPLSFLRLMLLSLLKFSGCSKLCLPKYGKLYILSNCCSCVLDSLPTIKKPTLLFFHFGLGFTFLSVFDVHRPQHWGYEISAAVWRSFSSQQQKKTSLISHLLFDAHPS